MPPDAVDTLDVSQLRANMVRGIYTLEAALFQQSGFEYERINTMREVIQELESILLDKVTVKSLNPYAKLRLYELVLRNQNESLKFLQSLHGNIASGLEALNHIERLKAEEVKAKGDASTSSAQALDQVKTMITNLLKERTNAPADKSR